MRIIKFDSGRGQAAAITEAIAVLKFGGVVAHATDTVWGLAADFSNPQAVQKIHKIKGTNSAKDLLVNVPSKKFVDSVGMKLCKFHKLAKEFWPGPVAFVILLKRGGTLGVRLPAHALSRTLARKFGGPLVTTSANPKGQLPATSAAEILQIFSKQEQQPDLVLDSGEICKHQKPSTLVDVSGVDVRLLRAGVIPFTQLQRKLANRS